MSHKRWFEHYKKTIGAPSMPERKKKIETTGRCRKCGNASFRLVVIVGKGDLIRSCKHCNYKIILK